MGYAIHVIDDDSIQSELFAYYLGLAGFEVRQDVDGPQGLLRMEAVLPDLVLLDVQMPEMDGLEVLRRMRASPRTRDVPVLLVSCMERSHARLRGLELGADDYITKGCSQPELLARVRAGLRRGARYKSLQHSFGGAIEDIGLATLLHTLQIGGRTASVLFTDIGAGILVGQGALRTCHLKRFTGSEALQRLFLVVRGRFDSDFDVTVGPAERSLATPHVLMDSLLAVDEVRRALEERLSTNPRVGLGPKGWTAPGRPRASLPMPALELVASMEGDLRNNAELVAGALRRDELRIVD
ncbi:MAG TPA: response regulator [Polyangiaceae bacterium]